MFNTPSVTKEQYDDLKATKTHVIDTLNWKLREAEWELKKVKDTQAFEIEKAVHNKAKEMQFALVESDLLRVEAVAKLNTYIDMDTKDDRKCVQKMLDKAITALGNKSVVIKR